jgi:hypothetical protein
VASQIIHLVSSNFYTKYFSIDTNTNFHNLLNIIRITTENIVRYEVIVHNSTCIEFIISIPYFLENLYKSGLEGLVDVVIGNHTESKKTNRSLLNNVLFVYEDISYSTIQALFSNSKINISGGSISKRHLLSTTEVNLSYILMSLNYNSTDIYNSSIIYSELLHRAKSIPANEINNNMDLLITKGLRITHIEKVLNFQIEQVINEINRLSLDLNSNKGNLLSLDPNSLETNKPGDYTDKLITSNNKNILYTKVRIERLNKKIALLNSKLMELNEELSSLNSLSFSDIGEKYLKLVVALTKRTHVNDFKKYFNKEKLSGIRNRREYSTMSSLTT